MTTLIDTKAIAVMLGLAVRTVRETTVKDPAFPRPAVRLNFKTQRWDVQDVEAWLEKRRKQAAR